MSVEDVLQLSSIFEGDEATKEFMRKRILALESAIHQQGLRFQHEVEEYRRLQSEEESLLREAHDISAVLDVISAQLQQTGNTFLENSLSTIFLKDVQIYNDATQSLREDISEMTSQIIALENWKKSTIDSHTVFSASQVLAMEKELHEVTAKYGVDQESLATTLATNAKMVTMIEETELEIKLLNEHASEFQVKTLECRDAAAMQAGWPEYHESIVTDIETKHNERMNLLRSKTQEAVSEMKRLSANLDTLKKLLAAKSANLARIVKAATETTQKLELMKLTENSLVAEVEQLKNQSLQIEKATFEKNGQLQMVKTETEGHKFRLESSQSTKSTLSTSAEALATECSNTTASLATIVTQIETTKHKLDTTEQGLAEVNGECRSRSELSHALQRIIEKQVTKEKVVRNVCEMTQVFEAFNSTFRDVGNCNDSLVLNITSASDDIDSMTKSRNELEGFTQDIESSLLEQTNTADLLRTQQITREELQEEVAKANKTITERSGTETALRQKILILRNDLDTRKMKKEEEYVKAESQRLFQLRQAEFVKSHNEKLLYLKQKVHEEDSRFQEKFAKAQNIFQQSQTRLKVDLQKFTSEESRHIDQREEQKRNLQHSIDRRSLLEENARALDIPITLTTPPTTDLQVFADIESPESTEKKNTSMLSTARIIPAETVTSLIRAVDGDPPILDSYITSTDGGFQSSHSAPDNSEECQTIDDAIRVEPAANPICAAGSITPTAGDALQQALPSNKRRKGSRRA